MALIQVLDSQTIDKIAAGEVVEKPSSVVKELVENAIDSHAGAVTVEIKEGGTTLIRVTDNGCGIEKEQVPNAFLRHATSKIVNAEDLFSLHTLGFRGEALASIAAVSQVEMITKVENALTGTKIEIEGGIVKDISEVGAPNGTTILVKNLFYNTPARKKFLKAAQTEAGYVAELMQHLAMSMPHLSIKLVINGSTKFATSGNGNLKEVIYRIYGRDTANALLPVTVEKDGICLEGFLGKPELARSNRSYENYFVNQRFVKSEFISKGIEEGYKQYMMQHKFPFCALHLNLDAQVLDVNVHPTKMEVRISNQQEVSAFLVDTIETVLHQNEMIPDVSLSSDKQQKEKIIAPEPFEEKRIKESEVVNTSPIENRTDNSNEIKTEFPGLSAHFHESVLFWEEGSEKEQLSNNSDSESLPQQTEIPKLIIDKPKQMDLFEEKLLSPQSRNQYQVLGQIFDTYWLIAFDDKLYMMDQHAAHEKVKYESLMQKFRSKEILSQSLNPPIVVALSMTETNIYLENKETFEKLGFEVDEFGGDEVMIRAVPLDLYGCNEKQLFLETLDELNDGSIKKESELIAGKIATMACKAAVKGNMSMTMEEVSALLDSLLKLENPYNCPHGRPTMIAMSKYEIEKKFKRIV